MRRLIELSNKYLEPAATPYTESTPLTDAYQAMIHVIGFGFDGTACFRKGTRFGPDALRTVSDDIETYSPYLDADLTAIKFADWGNLILPDGEIEQQWQQGTDGLYAFTSEVLSGANPGKLVTLGGEHSISYAAIKAYLENYPELVLLHLDAHADLRDGYLGYHFSHASIIRRVLDHFSDGHQLIQYGIRSGTKDEYQWMNDSGSLKKSRAEFLQAVAAIPANKPIYLTLDLDYFDPGIFPGTGTPEPGGEDFHSFISLIKILRDKRFVGCDVVELSPPLDNSGNSDVFATKVVRELLLTLGMGD